MFHLIKATTFYLTIHYFYFTYSPIAAPGATTVPTPTGTPPCADSGEMDCAAMDAAVNICADKTNPATVMYCPKYCKVC